MRDETGDDGRNPDGWLRRALRPVAGPHGLPLAGLVAVATCAAALLLHAGGLPAVEAHVFPFLDAGLGRLPALEGPDPRGSHLFSRALETRFLWAGAEIALALLLLAGLAAGIVVVRRSVEPPDRRAATGLVLSLSVGGAAAAATARLGSEVPHGLAGTFARDLFFAVDAFERHALGFGDRAFLDWTAFADVTDPLGAAAVVAVTVAFCALTLRVDRIDDGELRRRHGMAEMLLGISAGLLAVFVFEIHTLLRWPTVALDPGPLPSPEGSVRSAGLALAADDVRRLAGAFSATAGFLFSLALLATAGPAFWRLHREARARARRAASAGDAPEPAGRGDRTDDGRPAREGGSDGPTSIEASERAWLEANGLDLGVWRRIGHAVLVLVPTLSGVLGQPLSSALSRALGLG